MRIIRFAAWSSTTTTTSTFVPVRETCASPARFLEGCFSRTTVNQNVEPFPSSLSTPTCPPMSSTSCLEMDKPRPVPPYFRVVDPSNHVEQPKEAELKAAAMDDELLRKRNEKCPHFPGLWEDEHGRY